MVRVCVYFQSDVADMLHTFSNLPHMPPSTEEKPGFSLKNILSGDHDDLEHPTAKDLPEDLDQDDDTTAPQGYCVECEGTDACPYRTTV